MSDFIYGLRIWYRDPWGRVHFGDYFAETEEGAMERFWQGRDKDLYTIILGDHLGAYRKTDDDAEQSDMRKDRESASYENTSFFGSDSARHNRLRSF